MMTLLETKERIESDPKNWTVHLMEFVDDFRYHKDLPPWRHPLIHTTSTGMHSSLQPLPSFAMNWGSRRRHGFKISPPVASPGSYPAWRA